MTVEVAVYEYCHHCAAKIDMSVTKMHCVSLCVQGIQQQPWLKSISRLVLRRILEATLRLRGARHVAVNTDTHSTSICAQHLWRNPDNTLNPPATPTFSYSATGACRSQDCEATSIRNTSK